MKSLQVNAGTNKYKKAVWGKYRAMRNSIEKDLITEEQRQEIQKAY